MVVGSAQLWPGFPYLTRPAEEILATDDFREQVREVARFAYGVAEELKQAGFLPADLELVAPDDADG